MSLGSCEASDFVSGIVISCRCHLGEQVPGRRWDCSGLGHVATGSKLLRHQMVQFCAMAWSIRNGETLLSGNEGNVQQFCCFFLLI